MEWIDTVLGNLEDHKQCAYCNGFYGSCHGQPVCSTCHLFLFAIEPGEFERVPASEEDDGRDEQQSLDSGNEEPTDPDLVDESSGEIGDERPVYVGNGMNNRGRSREFVLTNSSPEHVNPGDVLAVPNPQDQLNKRVRALSQYKPYPPLLSSCSSSNDNKVNQTTTNTNSTTSGSHTDPHWSSRLSNSHESVSPSSSSSTSQQNFLNSNYPSSSAASGTFSSSHSHLPTSLGGAGTSGGSVVAAVTSRVPEEVFVSKIFPLLDDIQLFMCSRVCRRWRRIVLSLDLPWERFVRNRWPMFSPQFKITDWYETYSRLMDSMCCHRCFWSISHFTQTRNRRSRSLASSLLLAAPERSHSRTAASAQLLSSNPLASTDQRVAQTTGIGIGVVSLDQQFPATTGIYPQGLPPNPAVLGGGGGGGPVPVALTSRGWSVPNSVLSNPATGAVQVVRIGSPGVSGVGGFGDLMPGGGGVGLAPMGVNDGVASVDNERGGDCWRNRRLQSELQNLKYDPFLGLNAVKLDPAGYTWQASVEGPVGSPYEGGIFFIFMFIPETYPLKAPTVRFQTKILHPNISVHGDIGMESIGGVNWIPTLTLSKVLLSILSLLTDPNCDVSMNAEAAFLYRSDRHRFNRMAKLTTYKYAMIDYMQSTQFHHHPQHHAHPNSTRSHSSIHAAFPCNNIHHQQQQQFHTGITQQPDQRVCPSSPSVISAQYSTGSSAFPFSSLLSRANEQEELDVNTRRWMTSQLQSSTSSSSNPTRRKNEHSRHRDRTKQPHHDSSSAFDFE